MPKTLDLHEQLEQIWNEYKICKDRVKRKELRQLWEELVKQDEKQVGWRRYLKLN